MTGYVQKIPAYIERKGGKMRLHLGNLTVELVHSVEHPGPLGWENGQDPGVIFWQSDWIRRKPEVFEHGEQKPLAFENLEKNEVERIMAAVNDEQ